MPYKKIIALSALVLLIVGIGAAWWFHNRGDVSLQDIELQGASAILQYDLSDPRKVHFLWQGITGKGVTVNIYRSKDSSTWELWKQVTLPDASGTLSFEAGEGENARDYQYRVEVVSEDGDVTIVVPASPLAPPTTSPDEAASTSSTSTVSLGGTTPSSTSSAPSAPAPVTPVAPGATSTATSSVATTTAPAPAASNGGTRYTSYYSPNGELSGTSSIPLITDTFWVRHFGGNIEIGWQDLASDIASVLISRATSSAGPWVALLRHDNIGGVRTGSVQFLDGSQHEDHYYQLQTISTSNVTTTFGTLFLQGLP